MNVYREQFMRHPFLRTLARGGHPIGFWHDFVAERFLAAGLFVRLLETGIHKANAAGYHHLAKVLQQNLADELGLVDGSLHVDRAHSTWRNDMADALGIKPPTTSRGPAARYTTRLEQLLDAPALTIAGAIYYLEATIPIEFHRILVGLETDLPELFRLDASDTPDERMQKEKVRLYLNDHKLHDASDHAPKLEAALATFMRKRNTTAEIARGFDVMHKTKQDYLTELEEILT